MREGTRDIDDGETYVRREEVNEEGGTKSGHARALYGKGA